MGWREKLVDLQKAGVTVVVLQHNLDRKITSKNLSAGALSYTTDISDKWRISQVLVHASTALSNTMVTVKFNSLDGPNYDTKIGELDFDGTQDLAFISGDNMKGVAGEDGDEITIESSGSDSAGILYVTIIYELLA